MYLFLRSALVVALFRSLRGGEDGLEAVGDVFGGEDIVQLYS